jgi:gamma-glutamylcyclotransferase (GGCT)/AIG2-like uncharacterized protein YtfP
MQRLIVYGSLLHEQQLQEQGIGAHNTVPVKVFGYERSFTQEPSFRKGEGQHQLVLTIRPKETAWFNALLIKDLDEAYLEALDIRESGYERIKVEAKTYDGVFYKECFVYMGKSEKQNKTLQPNVEYMNFCLEGAKSLGQEFYEDFSKTTFKNSLMGSDCLGNT